MIGKTLGRDVAIGLLPEESVKDANPHRSFTMRSDIAGSSGQQLYAFRQATAKASR